MVYISTHIKFVFTCQIHSGGVDTTCRPFICFAMKFSLLPAYTSYQRYFGHSSPLQRGQQGAMEERERGPPEVPTLNHATTPNEKPPPNSSSDNLPPSIITVLPTTTILINNNHSSTLHTKQSNNNAPPYKYNRLSPPHLGLLLPIHHVPLFVRSTSTPLSSKRGRCRFYITSNGTSRRRRSIDSSANQSPIRSYVRI